jgi:hypothetical protein
VAPFPAEPQQHRKSDPALVAEALQQLALVQVAAAGDQDDAGMNV